MFLPRFVGPRSQTSSQDSTVLHQVLGRVLCYMAQFTMMARARFIPTQRAVFVVCKESVTTQLMPWVAIELRPESRSATQATVVHARVCVGWYSASSSATKFSREVLITNQGDVVFFFFFFNVL